jgi:uncharacterized protein YggU (UPF0235/DUF167 family)
VIRVSAPPIDGRANEAVRRLVAKKAGVAPSKVTVMRGHSQRDKTLLVDGVNNADLRAALGLPV